MAVLSQEQASSREKVLLTALLLSTPSLFVTGYAGLSSHSTTQFADFVRRTMELIAIFISWWVFHQIQRKLNLDEAEQSRLGRAAGLGVALAMGSSGFVMLIIALLRPSAYEPGGNVTLGLIIAVLGVLMNGWFWWRYASLTRE